MRISINKKVGLVVVIAFLSMLSFIFWSTEFPRGESRPLGASSVQTLSQLPPVMLWAWERPEQLNFVDPNRVGVAFLSGTINLSGDTSIVKRRQQPLSVPGETKLIAVVRIETDRRNRPELSPTQLERTATEVSRAAQLPNVLGVQIDFDAMTSERDFYRKLLFEVRRELPAAKMLSITALASWCSGDAWLADLPIDEAVPMLFRLGVEQAQFKSRQQSGYEFSSAVCRGSAGISTDEPVRAPLVTRLYIFNPESWSEQSLTKALEALNK